MTRQVALEDERHGEEDRQDGVAGEHVGEQTDGERDEPEDLAEEVDDPDDLLEHRRRAGRRPVGQVLDGPVLADAGVVREEEREERQHDGDVDVGRGRVEAQLAVPANGSGIRPTRLETRMKTKTPAM